MTRPVRPIVETIGFGWSVGLVLRRKRVLDRPTLGGVVESIDVLLELPASHSPYTPAADLDGRKLAGTDQRIDLCGADVQVGRNILQGQEPGFERGGGGCGCFGDAVWTHRPKIALGAPVSRSLEPFGAV